MINMDQHGSYNVFDVSCCGTGIYYIILYRRCLISERMLDLRCLTYLFVNSDNTRPARFEINDFFLHGSMSDIGGVWLSIFGS